MSSIVKTPTYYAYTVWVELTGGGLSVSYFEKWQSGAIVWTHPSPGVIDCLAADAEAFSYFVTTFLPFQKNMVYPMYDPDTLALIGYMKIDHLGSDEFQILTFDPALAPADIDLYLHIEVRTYVNVAIPA